jgi:hypothetical protein
MLIKSGNTAAVGVAYPWFLKDVAALREAMPQHRIPLVRPGSVKRRCAHCNIVIIVGPRLDSSGLTVICALCAHKNGVEGF